MTSTTITVRELDDLATPIGAALTQVTAFTPVARVNDVPDDNKLTVQNDHPRLADLVYGRVIVLEQDGTPTHSFVIEADHDDRPDPGNVSKDVTTVQGRPLPSILDRATVRPTLGYEKSPYAPSRVYSFASPEFTPDGSWVVPTVIVPTVGTESTYYTGLPDGFWCPAEPWIGPAAGDDSEAPFGYWYSLYNFTLAADLLVVFGMAVDDRAQVFIDGFLLAAIDPNADPTSGYRTTTTQAVRLSAGAHRFAVKVINDFGDVDPGFGEGATVAGNPTAFTMTAWQADAAGRLVQRLFGTADYADWLSLEYPDTPPGFTIKQIIRIIVDENQAETLIADVTIDGSDDTLDSKGNTFDVLETVTVNVGDSLLALLKTWALSYLDFAMPAAEQRLQLWRWEERGTPSGVTYSPADSNLGPVAYDTVDTGTDCLDVAWSGGPNFRYPATGGTRKGFVKTNAHSRSEAESVAAAVIAKQTNPLEQVTLGVLPAAGSVPGLDHELGDTVTAPARGGGTLTERVMEHRGSYTDKGMEWSIAVRDVHLSSDDLLALQLQRMANGSLGGTAPAAPTDLPKFGTKLSQHEVTFSLLDPPAVSESPDKIPSASANLYALAVTAKTAGATDTTFELLLDGVDVLAGAGVLPAGETFVQLPMIASGTYVVYWVEGNKTRLAINVTAVGVDVTGMLFEPRFV